MEKASENIQILALMGYMITGLPVVWLHVRQQKMRASINALDEGEQRFIVFFTLATVWPLILLSMSLNRMNRRRSQVTRERRSVNDNRLES